MDVPQYAPGQQLAGTVYRVVRHLATGGMGSVYDVEDVSVGKRYVLKTLHPQLVSRQDLAKRMEAEARALAKLQHPNIVDVVTAGVTTDEKRMPFYVMERLNGQNLRVVIDKKGSLELAHCFRIAIDVLDALEHAHENSVIHRDVKPENIFLHRNANGTTITKLLDFGIMRLLDRKVSHTQGQFIGTLRYASPEQIFGGELGPQTDIYSLGIVLYEMLSGRGPFDDIGDAYAIGAAHAQRPPPPLAQFVALPQALERLVMTSLAKSPQDRPRDCFSFASELRRMLRDEEAAPKSATQVNVLSSVPEARAASALAGTEPSSEPIQRASRATTDVGIVPPPPAQQPELGAAILPPTARDGLGRGASATALGRADTIASEPGRRSDPVAAPVHADPPAEPGIDRAAETHASGASGMTQRLAQNGTAVDDPAPPTPPDEARGGPLVFAQPSTYATGTGPLAGEAPTRPPSDRGMLLPLAAAAAFGAILVGGAVLVVTKPWARQTSAVIGASPAIITALETSAPMTPSLPTLPLATAAQTTDAGPSPLPGAGTDPGPRPGAARPTTRPVARPEAPALSATAPGAPRKPTRPAPSGPRRPEDVGFE